MTAARRPRLDDLGVPYTIQQPVVMRRRALHQAEPMRLRTAGDLARQTVVWLALALLGAVCVVFTTVVAWGTWQACAWMLRAFLGGSR
jgi:hypothetical protein